jgi:hypothetical protein
MTIYIATAASALHAHHSQPYFYDQCKSITIEGRVERVEFKDPHTWIVLRRDEGTAYTVDWAPLSGLTNKRIIGPAKEALVFGARVVVTGNPIRARPKYASISRTSRATSTRTSSTPHRYAVWATVSMWALSPSPKPPNCDHK